MKMEEQFNKKFDMDYDGMGNQGRFPVTKKIENMKEDVISGALKAIIIILLFCIVAVLFTGCEKELLFEQVCCDWDAVNFDPEYNGHNVNQLYFTGSDLCNNDLCIYP